MKTREADVQRSPWHTHVFSALLAVVVIAAALSGTCLYGLITDKHTEGHWTLVAAPDPIPGGLKLTVEDDEVRGQGPCNLFVSRWSQDDDTLGDMTASTVLCPSDVAEQEGVYFAVLSAVTNVAVEGDRMTLSGPAGQLQFERAS